jgi:hypothetical protein
MSLKHRTTKHKFYNKWDYKISFHAKGMNYLRFMPFREIPTNHPNKELIDSLHNTLKNLDKNHYGKRIESSILDLYFNDEDLYNSFYNQYRDKISVCFSPAEGTKSIMANGKTILAKKLPHSRYKFKVFLRPYKIKSIDEKVKYINWLTTQKPKIQISPRVKSWFLLTSWNWDRRYMYVEDEQMLLMLKLRNAEVIGSTYTYEVIDK